MALVETRWIDGGKAVAVLVDGRRVFKSTDERACNAVIIAVEAVATALGAASMPAGVKE